MNARQFYDLIVELRKAQKQAANTSMFGKEDWKQRLEDYFKIEL